MERKPRLVVAKPADLDTREGLAAFFTELTGRAPTERELDEAFAADGPESPDEDSREDLR